MDKMMFLVKTSDLPSVEAAESVPFVVQTASSAGLRLIGVVLVIMLVILTILTITLIMIEMRQGTLSKRIYAMAKRLERMEERMLGDDNDLTAETLASADPIHRGMNYDAAQTAVTKLQPDESAFGDDSPDDAKAADVKTVPQTSGHPIAAPSEKSYPIAGLRVNVSSHYNLHSPVNFDEVSIQDAIFILYSDMTVQPNNRQFNVYNNASYYTTHDFNMIFDFEDREGYPVDMEHSLKCLKVAKHATVINSKSGYLLDEKGILIVEER